MYVLNHRPLYSAVSSIIRIHGSGNQEIEAGVTLLTIIPDAPLRDFVLPAPTTLDSAGLEVLVPKESILSPGDIAKVPLNYKPQLLPGHFERLPSRNQQARRIAIQQG